MLSDSTKIFTKITSLEIPTEAIATKSNFLPETKIVFVSDGVIPFPQLIIRGENINELVISALSTNNTVYSAVIPSNCLAPGSYQVQAEGCKKSDIKNALPDDWIKAFGELHVLPFFQGSRLYFAIHKHMHQPYYRAVDKHFWDGSIDEIFRTRSGPYCHFIKNAVDQYQQLPHSGLSMSWSGSLIEQLNRASKQNLCESVFHDWKRDLLVSVSKKTSSGSSRAEFSAFGFFHPLMPLIPSRDIKAQILLHRQLVYQEFGVESSTILFPPETAFHVRMIPALLDAGITAVIYDSIHRYRSCRDYPYSGIQEGMLPPNPSDQENPPVSDWMQLTNVWAASKISPSLLKPEYVKYEDINGSIFKIIAIPAERYIGNEDARGGFGALVYPNVLGQVLSSDSFDPQHPPFFILHSDGDNHGGGSDSYYGCNTGRLIEWLKSDPRFELTSIPDYLTRFPPNPDQAIHIEPGSWSGADNGDPQFKKWFSRSNDNYSPDLNSWAVLTAFQNVVHTLLDADPTNEDVKFAERLLLTAEASDYWYWTGQDVWDKQVTEATNAGLHMINSYIEHITDKTGPTIFPPWITPENPGGLTWGSNSLRPADKVGIMRTFIYDVSGLKYARVFIRLNSGDEKVIPLVDKGKYPCHTGAAITSNLFEVSFPEGIGNVRFWIEAEDNVGNISRSSLERIFLA